MKHNSEVRRLPKKTIVIIIIMSLITILGFIFVVFTKNLKMEEVLNELGHKHISNIKVVNRMNVEDTQTKISLTYHNPNGFYTRADIKNQGSLYFYDDVQKDFLKNDAYTTIDLKLGYKFQNWNIYGFVNNLTDEEYITYYQSSTAVSVSTFGDQRTIGMGIRYTF